MRRPDASTIARDLRFLLGIVRGRPFSLLVQITNRCNMRCGFCGFWRDPAPPREELDLPTYARLSAELSELGTFLVSIEGGEPLLRADLEEIIAAFARHHLTVLFTNGSHVDRASAASLFRAGIGQVCVSIDHLEEAEHDEDRGFEGAAKRAWEALIWLRDAAPRGGRQVAVMTVVHDGNLHALEPLLERTAALGVGHQLTLLSQKGAMRAGGRRSLPGSEAGPILRELFRRHRHLRYLGDYLEGVGRYLDGEAIPSCRAGLQGFNLDHRGELSPCIEWLDRSVGNVRDQSVRALLERMKALRPAIATCDDCFTACRGIQDALGGGAKPSALLDLMTRMRTY
ncbi:MAG: radical SAM protein [Myxococcales bacterium]|nr:radical SAM protein [Myxococcales bacterium]